MPSDTELPEGGEQQTASQAVHTAEKTRAQSGQAPMKRTVTERATETFRTTWIKKQLVKIQLTKIKFDTALTRGQTRERDEDSVLSRMASLRGQIHHADLSQTFSYGETKVHYHPISHIGILTHSCRLGTAVPISLISRLILPACNALLSQLKFPTAWAGLIS